MLKLKSRCLLLAVAMLGCVAASAHTTSPPTGYTAVAVVPAESYVNKTSVAAVVLGYAPTAADFAIVAAERGLHSGVAPSSATSTASAVSLELGRAPIGVNAIRRHGTATS